MPFARVVALDGDRLGRSLADGSFDDGSLERFTRACDSRMQDNVPFFVTFQDVTTEAARLEVEAKARADLSTGTGDQNNKDGSTQRLLPPLRPPTGWPLSERPPDLARVPPGWWQRWPAISNAPPGWKDPVAAEAQCAFYFRCVSLPAALPFLMFGNLLRELSWLCLILRSALPADEAVERFDRVFLALKSGIVEAAEAIPHIGLVLEPVIALAGGIFRTLFIYLDPFKVMDQLFELVPDAQIRCRGTQQPWFLLANLCLAAVIVMVVSAVMDSHDAFRFQRAWDVLTRGWEKKTSSHGGNKWVYRAPLMPTVATVGAEPAERVLVYGVRVLVLLSSSRPFILHKTGVCNDASIGILTMAVAYLSAPFIFTVLLASFVQGVGPAPPTRTVPTQHANDSVTNDANDDERDWWTVRGVRRDFWCVK